MPRRRLLMVVLAALFSTMVPVLAMAGQGHVRSRLQAMVDEILPSIEAASGPVAVTSFQAVGEAAELELESLFTSTLLAVLEEKEVSVRDPEALARIMDESALMTLAGGDHGPA